MRWVLALALVAAGCGRMNFAREGGGDDDDGGVGDGARGDGARDGANGDTGAQPFTVYVISGDGSGPTELLTLELSTGKLTSVGTFAGTLGNVGGLAYWDPNTLYGTVTNGLVKITLSPFSAANVSTMPGTWSALERDGTELFGIDQTSDSAAHFTEANAAGPFPSMPLGVDAQGGDVTIVGTTYYWITNSAPAQLYTLTPGATAVGQPIAASPFIAGIVADAAGNLFVTSNDTDSLYPISKTTGQLGTAIPLTKGGAAYDLLSGDLSRTP